MVLTISMLRKHLLGMYRGARSNDVSYRETSYEDHLAAIGTEGKCPRPSSHSVCEKMGQASLDSFYSTALDDRGRPRWQLQLQIAEMLAKTPEQSCELTWLRIRVQKVVQGFLHWGQGGIKAILTFSIYLVAS